MHGHLGIRLARESETCTFHTMRHLARLMQQSDHSPKAAMNCKGYSLRSEWNTYCITSLGLNIEYSIPECKNRVKRNRLAWHVNRIWSRTLNSHAMLAKLLACRLYTTSDFWVTMTLVSTAISTVYQKPRHSGHISPIVPNRNPLISSARHSNHTNNIICLRVFRPLACSKQ